MRFMDKRLFLLGVFKSGLIASVLGRKGLKIEIGLEDLKKRIWLMRFIKILEQEPYISQKKVAQRLSVHHSNVHRILTVELGLTKVNLNGFLTP